MKVFKKNKRIIKGTNAIDPATSTNRSWGYTPVPNNGGKTTNYEIPEWMFERELNDMKEGIIHA